MTKLAYFSGRQQLVYVTFSIVSIAYVTLILHVRNLTNIHRSLLAPEALDQVVSQKSHKKHPQHKHINQHAHRDQMSSYGITVGTSPGSTTNTQVPELFKVSNILQSWHDILILS